jgi:hypothetical protein
MGINLSGFLFQTMYRVYLARSVSMCGWGPTQGPIRTSHKREERRRGDAKHTPN